jgi:hypothetical protein
LNCDLRPPGVTDTMARMAPFWGLIETIADEGSPGSLSVALIAAAASFWKRGSIVV